MTKSTLPADSGAEAILKALRIGQAYVLDAMRNDGGIENCEIGYRTDFECIQSALSAALSAPAPAQGEVAVARNQLVISAYRAMDAIDAIRAWCDSQTYENDLITVAHLREMLPPAATGGGGNG